MAFVKPKFDKPDIDRAGRILATANPDGTDWSWAYDVLANWRACHGYPINTFQALLRKRVKAIAPKALVAQRLKRAPSVVAKLQRFTTMNLSQMQDIGGLRAVVSTVPLVRKLEKEYRATKFKHKLVSSKDYITNPKEDGYRSIHLIYRYANDAAPEYNGLLLELQFRTKLQHAWATAVETMSTFLGQALKFGGGERQWRQFFEIASAAFTFIERTAPVPGYASLSKAEVFSKAKKVENDLQVLFKLRGFAIAANKITTEKGAGSYHLIVLDSANKTVTIQPFPKTQLEEANIEYAKVEERTQRGEQVEAVLVSAGPIDALKKAYPSYFLDAEQFVTAIERYVLRT
ncbi:MAG: RelA/SpoT domain-containing protein [candidate division Zixibacteria bacterium]|nr:RelA/SpoT domain-containing protein [candidate division Zixibacteria bacterium]